VRALLFLSILLMACPTMAVDLGHTAPAKPIAVAPVSPVDPALVRQGGDTFQDAFPITFPYAGTGTTAGYADDYDAECPYDAQSPDVVYSLVPAESVVLTVDLLGSSYDTKLHVYDQDLNRIACNDDFHPDYTSKIEQLWLQGGVLYYLVIDGYGESSGDYVLTISEYEPCLLECPAGAQLEGEPPLTNGYIDEWNGGCNTEGSTPFQIITNSVFCGVSGFYDFIRDTDWFIYTMPAGGVLEVTGDAEDDTYMFELGPQNCDEVGVIQNVIIGPCNEATMTITGEPGSTVWFWVGPTTFGEGVVVEYDYVLLSNIEGTTAIENHSLSAIKGLFN